MTLSGICDNASYEETRLTTKHARKLLPSWRRTIVYPWSFDTVVDSARELAALGIKTEVVFTTESAGCDVDDLSTYCDSLDRFLTHADGAVAAVSLGNELDTPGWTDSQGSPISDELIIRVGRAGSAVCRRHNVSPLAPSLLSGPSEGRFERIAKGLKGYVDAMVIHPYYRSLGGYPFQGWSFGTVEDAADECARLGSGLPTWFDEVGCPTLYRNIGQDNQAKFTSALRQFQHPSIPVVMQFALHDHCGSRDELNLERKDWGLISASGDKKSAYTAFSKYEPPKTQEPKPVPAPPKKTVYTLDEVRQIRWQAIVPDAEYHAEWGFESYWRDHPELGSPLTTQELTLDTGEQCRPFANGIAIYRDGKVEVQG